MKLFDLHCDTLYECCKQGKDLLENDLQLSLNKGAGFDGWRQFFAVWMPDELRGEAAVEHFQRCRAYLDEQLTKHADKISLWQRSFAKRKNRENAQLSCRWKEARHPAAG